MFILYFSPSLEAIQHLRTIVNGANVHAAPVVNVNLHQKKKKNRKTENIRPHFPSLGLNACEWVIVPTFSLRRMRPPTRSNFDV